MWIKTLGPGTEHVYRVVSINSPSEQLLTDTYPEYFLRFLIGRVDPHNFPLNRSQPETTPVPPMTLEDLSKERTNFLPELIRNRGNKAPGR